MSVRVEKNGPVTTVILDRPDVRNAVDRPTAEALADAFRAFDADETASVGVFYGANGAFCAGADLKAFADEARRNRLAWPGDGPMGPSRLLLSKPVIAAVSGYAVAGGMELALWCDLRVMEEDAVWGVFCRRWGVPLVDGGTVRLPRLIGLSHALDLILTGRPVGAEEALRMGLANRVVPRGAARAAAEALAQELAHFPQLCLRADRRSAYQQFDFNLTTALQHEFANGLQVLHAEGLAGAARFAAGAGRHGSFVEIEERRRASVNARLRAEIMARETAKKKRRISDEAVRETILQMCAAAGPDDSVRPEDVAMELYPEDWQSLLKRVRLLAKQLAQAGEIEILRKGEPVDPEEFKGLIRLRITEAFLRGENEPAME